MSDPIDLDQLATTPCDPRVLEAMLPWFGAKHANPDTLYHPVGRQARQGVEVARGQVATLLEVDVDGLIFTSGATEANNLAIFGIADALRDRGRHVLVSATEHSSTLEPARALRARGFRVDELPVGRTGVLDPDDVRRALQPDTVLFICQWVNNVTGAIQPLDELTALCQHRGIAIHVDAAQGAGRMLNGPWTRAASTITLSSHKLHGPAGVGALWVHPDSTQPKPLMVGGDQERKLRPGTLPVALVVGFGEAARLAQAALAAGEDKRLAALRDLLLAELRALGDVHPNGDLQTTAPHALNVEIQGCLATALIAATTSVRFSASSACSSSSRNPSHVLLAMGISVDEARRSVRFGLGRFTQRQDILRASSVLGETIRGLRALGKL